MARTYEEAWADPRDGSLMEWITEQGYAVEDGVITSPGKFEREPVYTPAIFEMMMLGWADYTTETEYGDTVDIFRIGSTDGLEALGWDSRYEAASIHTDSQGFVYVSVWNTFDEALAHVESDTGDAN